MSAAAPVAEPRRATLAFIFVTVVLDVLAFGVIIPVFPALVASFYPGDLAHAATVYGLIGTVFAAMQFLCSPVLGALSDRFGRRPVILLSNAGLGLDFVVMALANSIPLLFLGRVLAGMTAASITTAGAYIADVTPPERRAAGFGLIGAAFGLGFVIGPALGGVLGAVDPRLPFWVAAVLCLANAVWGLFVLPESLPPERRAAFSWRRAHPLGALRLLRSHRELAGLAAVTFLSQLAHVALPAVFVLYAGHRYGWDARAVGGALALVGVCSAVVQAGLVRRVVARFGESRTLVAGLAFGATGFALYGLAPVGALFLVGIPIMALWGLAGPATQALMTRRLGPSEQGQLQGALMSLAGIAGMLGPTLFSLTFSASIRVDGPQLPGAAFLLAAALLAASSALARRVLRAHG